MASSIFNNAKKFIKSSSPELLTGTAVAGVFATGYLSAVAGYKMAKSMEDEDPWRSNLDVAKAKWKLYIPPVGTGFATITCIIAANRIANNRIAAGVAAYSLANQAFSEYRDKVVEEFGENKEQKVRDDIASDKVNATENREVIIAGSGHVLCCELQTRRYFRSDMETLRKAQNDINASILSDLYVTLDEFYDLIGLSHTTHSDSLGWDSDKLMELKFTTVLTDDGEPCLAFDYNYLKPLD